MITTVNKGLLLNEVKVVCNIEKSKEIISFLTKKGYWDDNSVWRYLGDNENNYASIGNQQSHPVSSIVEKIVNAFDAIIMNIAKEMGIDLYKIYDPAKTKANIMAHIQKSTSTATEEKRIQDDMSRLVAISLTGGKNPDNPNVTIADRGEGQTPDSLPDTILSLAKSNKIRIPIVQGKHNMGGSGEQSLPIYK
ncbi:hypothetical protein [Bacillus sp. 1P02SD]|uniref:hypothetical protein n=1 Tax=Bacillus sp. 1P02SD TaxID=3132264 RepID=UPI00399F4DCE